MRRFHDDREAASLGGHMSMYGCEAPGSTLLVYVKQRDGHDPATARSQVVKMLGFGGTRCDVGETGHDAQKWQASRSDK